MLQALKGRPLKQIEDYTAGSCTDRAYDNALSMLDTLYGGEIREMVRSQIRFTKTRPLQAMTAGELSRVFIACSGMKDFHEFNGNSYCLTNSALADFRDARSKLGDYLHDFDLWVIKNQEPPSFNTLVKWLKIHIDASQLSGVIDGFEEDFEEEANVSVAGQSQDVEKYQRSRGFEEKKPKSWKTSVTDRNEI